MSGTLRREEADSDSREAQRRVIACRGPSTGVAGVGVVGNGLSKRYSMGACHIRGA